MVTPKRVCILTVTDGKQTIEFANRNSVGPRIVFTVVRHPQGQKSGANTAQIKIYNINEQSFTALMSCAKPVSTGKGHTNVNLVAGHEDDYSLIYSGTIHSVFKTKEGPDTITILYCSSLLGNIMNKTVAKSYTTITLNKFLDTLASDFGMTITRPNFTDTITNRTFFGSVEEILSNLGVRYNFTYETDKDKTIKIIKKGQNDKVVYTFDPSSGLLKPPIVTEKGVDIDVLMKPALKPNDVFMLNASFVNFNLGAMEWTDRVIGNKANTFIHQGKDGRFVGKYRILQMIIDGDTHGNNWRTHIESLTESMK